MAAGLVASRKSPPPMSLSNILYILIKVATPIPPSPHFFTSVDENDVVVVVDDDGAVGSHGRDGPTLP